MHLSSRYVVPLGTVTWMRTSVYHSYDTTSLDTHVLKGLDGNQIDALVIAGLGRLANKIQVSGAHQVSEVGTWSTRDGDLQSR